jgi:hypothetical protein
VACQVEISTSFWSEGGCPASPSACGFALRATPSQDAVTNIDLSRGLRSIFGGSPGLAHADGGEKPRPQGATNPGPPD